MRKNKQGISLIVLVITIIIMVILAAAIIISLENTGVIGAAENAVCKTNIKQAQNLAVLKWAELYTKGERDTEVIKEKIKEEFTKNKLNPDNYNIEVTTGGVEVSSKVGCIDASGVEGGNGDSGDVEPAASLVYAYTYNRAADTWTPFTTNDGTEPTGDVVVKLYAAGNGETIINNVAQTVNTYKMIVSGTGEFQLHAIKDLYENDVRVLDKVVEMEVQEGITSITKTDSGFYYMDGLYNMLEIVKLPNSLVNISGYAFYGCTNLKQINIPNGVTTIGNHAFYNCKSIENVELPEGLTTLDGYAFANCSSLTSIAIPSTITSIRDYLFQDCESLKNVNIPEGVTGISYYAFSGCVALQNVVFPNSLTGIDNGAFGYCSSLTRVVLKENVTYLGSGAFGECVSLESIVLPKSLKNISQGAFYNSNALSTINYRGNEEEWSSINGEEYVPSTATIVYNYTGN